MIDAVKQAMDFVEDKNRDDLDRDILLRFALLRAIEVMGEAAARISPKMREAHPEIPWRLVVNMRNRLIHAYFDVNLDIVWATVTSAFPEILSKIAGILEDGEH